MLRKLRELSSRSDERGASAVEYGLLVAAIAAVIVVMAFALGNIVKGALFNDTCQVIHDETPGITGSCEG